MRRAALGVIRLLLASDIRLPLGPVIGGQLLDHELRDNLDSEVERDLYALYDMLDDVAGKGLIGAALDALAERLLGGRDDAPEAGSWLDRLKARSRAAVCPTSSWINCCACWSCIGTATRSLHRC